jgi:predicted ABC-type ATPase
VEAVLVLTASAELNVFRVRARTIGGGHGVLDDKIRSRHAKSLAKLPELRRLSDTLEVYDNTGTAPRLIFRRSAGRPTAIPDACWPEAAIRAPVGLDVPA